MRGPCLCGDTHCPSCGPAQGNWRCRAWADDGCEHIAEDGSLYPEFQPQADAIAEAERLADEQFAKDLEEEARLAEEYWRSQK